MKLLIISVLLFSLAACTPQDDMPPPFRTIEES